MEKIFNYQRHYMTGEARTKEEENTPGAHTCIKSCVCIIVSAFGRTVCGWMWEGMDDNGTPKQFATRLQNTETITVQLELRNVQNKIRQQKEILG